MNVNEAIARVLKQEGVEWIACFPNNPLIETCAKEGIRPIAFRHERGACMAADAYSRLNDRKKFGVFMMQNQAGSENAMGAIAQAFADNVPILVLPGAPTTDRLQVRPEFWPSRAYQPFTKHAESLIRADQVYAAMRRAFHGLRNGRPGPMVLDIPTDVGNAEVPDSAVPYTSPKAIVQVPTRSDVQDTVRAIANARRPIIWAGMGVLLGGASDELTQLAELLEVPVFCTLPGKSAMDERHPLALGAGSGATTAMAQKWLAESDVLFAVGSSLTITGYGQRIPPGKFIIHNTVSQEDINKDHGADIGLAGDVKATLQMLIEETKAQFGERGRRGTTNVLAEIAEVKRQFLADWATLYNDDSEPINPYRVIAEIDRNVDKDRSVVTHDAGAPRDMMVPTYVAGAPHSYIGWGKTTHLGYGIPLMIGAKMAMPDRFCLNFMGDGAFGMSGLDIETSVRAGLPITTVVLNNGIMATYPGGFPTAREQFGVSYMGGDYAMIAEGMGAVGIRVTHAAELAPAIKRAQQLNDDGKTVLIDVKTRAEDRRAGRG